METKNEKSDSEKGEFLGVFTGRVVHVKHGYGFIRPDDARVDDVFCHYQDVEPWREGFKELRVGDAMKFEVYRVRPGGRGLKARNAEIMRKPVPDSVFLNKPDNVGNRKEFEHE